MLEKILSATLNDGIVSAISHRVANIFLLYCVTLPIAYTSAFSRYWYKENIYLISDLKLPSHLNPLFPKSATLSFTKHVLDLQERLYILE